MNGPFDQANNGYGFNDTSGAYLARTRQACSDLLRATAENDMKANITGCVLQRFTELDKALFASRQYILTLWPAFVGAIVALAPDPSVMVYDNIWWVTLFAVTSGGLPGVSEAAPPHHIEARSETEGRAMCEAWSFDPARPKAASKEDTMGASIRGRWFIYVEWLSFFASLSLWLTFVVYFTGVLEPALDITFANNWQAGAMWYYLSASPAVIGLTFELIRNRVDLYEPLGIYGERTELAMMKDGTGRIITQAGQQRFSHVKVASSLHLWLRVLHHQWRRSQYRVLIRNRQSPKHEWIFVIGRLIVGASRFAIFTVGSITMGNIILMPVPDDLHLFLLLLFTTILPRQIWDAFWTNGNRGADLVVWVKMIRLAGRASS